MQAWYGMNYLQPSTILLVSTHYNDVVVTVVAHLSRDIYLTSTLHLTLLAFFLTQSGKGVRRVLSAGLNIRRNRNQEGTFLGKISGYPTYHIT